MKGRLFYVVGASGAGKDTLCEKAREAWSGSVPLHFAHRYITRAAGAGGENHVALSHSEFRDRRRHGLFAMDWEGHGNGYGIGIEVDHWLDRGVSVVVNGSRGYLKKAVIKYPEMVVIQVAVSREVLRQRLIGRGRESLLEIEKRLHRTDALPPITPHVSCLVSNDDAIEVSVTRFLRVLRSHLPKDSGDNRPCQERMSGVPICLSP